MAESVSSVSILDADLCPRYAARIITDVHVAPSPEWLQTRLESVGLRSINNVVDATNYVLWELGHPMHAFDMDKLDEKRIVVRRARSGEIIRTLDGVDQKLAPEMLVIADAHKPVALAGIMGGEDSEVSDATTNVLLESAYFDPVSIRKTSRKLGISTEASYRFERGADYHALVPAADRCAAMIKQLAGGTILKGVLDEAPPPEDPEKFRWPKSIRLRIQRVSKIIGQEIAPEAVEDTLNALELTVRSKDDDGWTVDIPSFRVDLFEEIDLIEEVARLYGYDKVNSTYPRLAVEPLDRGTPHRFQGQVSDLMISCGLDEVVTYSFMGEKDLDRLNVPAESPLRQAVRLNNPLSQEESLMRTTLVPRLLAVYDHNQRRGQKNVAIYELGNTYRKVQNAIEEHCKLGVVLAGNALMHWSIPDRQFDFFDVKGLAESLLKSIQATDISTKKTRCPFLAPERGIDLFFQKTLLGSYGELSQDVVSRMDFLGTVALLEMDLEVLQRAVGEDQRKLVTPSQYPAVERDIAVLISRNVTSEEIVNTIKKTGKKNLESVELFDRYTGKQIEKDKVSLALRLVFRAPDRTLTEEEVNQRYEKILKALQHNHDAVLRT